MCLAGCDPDSPCTFPLVTPLVLCRHACSAMVVSAVAFYARRKAFSSQFPHFHTRTFLKSIGIFHHTRLAASRTVVSLSGASAGVRCCSRQGSSWFLEYWPSRSFVFNCWSVGRGSGQCHVEDLILPPQPAIDTLHVDPDSRQAAGLLDFTLGRLFSSLREMRCDD